MKPVGGRRNFGWGKQISWAGKQALKAHYANGHFGTVASHSARWRNFCAWLKNDSDIKDARQIRREHVTDYATHLAQQANNESDRTLSVSYAKNQITSINVTLESIRGNRHLWIKPGDYVDKRTLVRTEIPKGLDRNQFNQSIYHLKQSGHERVAAIALLCRELGLRRKEAILLDLRLANHQARTLGKVNITAGTKGGRGKSIDRWVPVSTTAKVALEQALLSASKQQKLMPEDTSLGRWMTRVSKVWNEASQQTNLGTLRDLRAAYACDRYHEITNHSAPVVAGCGVAEKNEDTAAREIISQELGHNRLDVVSAYVGSSH